MFSFIEKFALLVASKIAEQIIAELPHIVDDVVEKVTGRVVDQLGKDIADATHDVSKTVIADLTGVINDVFKSLNPLKVFGGK